MTQRRMTVIFTLIVAVFSAAQSRAQTNEPIQTTDSVSAATPAQKIITKDPDYLKLLHPPEGNEFLKLYSESYREKSAEIEVKVAALSDDNLRNQTANEEWAIAHKNDGDKFTYEAQLAFHDAKMSFAQRHREGWFPVGRVNYEELNNVLAALSDQTAPIVAAIRVPMKPATLNQIYARFHDIAGQEIDKKAHEHVANSGAGSNCSRNADWCYKYAKEDIEQNLRSERLVFVAQGDLENMRIDRLLLVDYDTEAILLELDGRGPGLSSAAWRFSVGPIPTAPVAPVAAENQIQPAVAGSEQDGTSSSKESSTRVSVPANVTAASIVTQTRPEYPSQARASHIQGEVVLHAIIDKEGKIAEVQVLSGDDVLAKSALEAVRQWKYKPMLVDGEPKVVDTTITVTFSLGE